MNGILCLITFSLASLHIHDLLAYGTLYDYHNWTTVVFTARRSSLDRVQSAK